MRFLAKLKGGGTAAIAAYGAADAEATVEKELRRALPAAKVDVRGIRRADEDPHIVEEFLIDYVVRLEVVTEGGDEAEARKNAFSTARAALKGSRFEKIIWETAVLSPQPTLL